MADVDDGMKKLQRLAQVARVFTPAAPISSVDLFAGRQDQLLTLFDVLSQPGQHAVLYGERGVGKTSLANIVGDVFSDRKRSKIRTLRINCSTDDTYAAVWQRVFKKMGVDVAVEAVDPDRVLHELSHAGGPSLVVIDELDRFEDDQGLSLMTDTIKALSDHDASTTLVVVGVADSVDQLIGDHRSVERALLQVQMPRMSIRELTEIVDRGLKKLALGIDADARRRIGQLSQGLPSYAHLLSLHAAQKAIQDDRDRIHEGDTEYATRQAVRKVQQSVLNDYHNAVRSTKKHNIFPEVLLACAVAPKDEVGFFAPGDIREPLSKILGRKVKISAYLRHLKKFTGEERGSILQKRPLRKRAFYRFASPILQPFVILRGLADKTITEETLSEFRPEEPNETLEF